MRLGTLEEQDLEKIGVAGAEIAELPIHLITSARTIQTHREYSKKAEKQKQLGLASNRLHTVNKKIKAS